jgi:hypothetical protein
MSIPAIGECEERAAYAVRAVAGQAAVQQGSATRWASTLSN